MPPLPLALPLPLNHQRLIVRLIEKLIEVLRARLIEALIVLVLGSVIIGLREEKESNLKIKIY